MKKVVVVLVCLVLLSLTACATFEVRAGEATAPAPQAPVTATPWPTAQPPERPIYIVDPNDQGTLSRILVVDPDQRSVAFEITTRFLPDIVLSEDGRRLYVADSYLTRVIRGEPREVLSVYDALNGQLLVDDISIPGRLLYKGFPNRDPFLFLSDGEQRLYVMKYGDPDIHRLRLSVLDPETLRTLYEGNWPPCGYRIQTQSDRWLCVNGVAIDVVDPIRATVIETQMTIPGLQVAGLALTADGHRLYVTGPDAAVTVIDVQQRAVLATARLEVEVGSEIVRGSTVVSPDGRRLYVGFDTGDDERQVFTDAIAVYDAATWEKIATIKLRDTLTHFALSVEGDQLYAVSPFARSLAIYDTTTAQEVALLSDLGGAPARVVVPPVRQ